MAADFHRVSSNRWYSSTSRASALLTVVCMISTSTRSSYLHQPCMGITAVSVSSVITPTFAEPRDSADPIDLRVHHLAPADRVPPRRLGHQQVDLSLASCTAR